MEITVMGPGGVGGYFGARLAAAGSDVTFVAVSYMVEFAESVATRLEEHGVAAVSYTHLTLPTTPYV